MRDLRELRNLRDLLNITFFTYSAGIIIAITVVMIGWTFYGFLGAIHESKCMLGPYLLGMLVMFMVMTAGLSLGFFHSKDKLQFALEETMKDYKTNVTLENSTFDNSASAKNLTFVMGDIDVSRAWDRVRENVSELIYPVLNYQKEYSIPYFLK